MPFKQNHKLSTGRPKGAGNLASKDLKSKISLVVENNMEKLQSDLDDMKPVERANILLGLLKFVMPTMKAIDMTVESKMLRQPIIIELGGADPTEDELRGIQKN